MSFFERAENTLRIAITYYATLYSYECFESIKQRHTTDMAPFSVSRTEEEGFRR